MSQVESSDYGIPAVALMSSAWSDLLSRAQQIKTVTNIEPPLEKATLETELNRLSSIFSDDCPAGWGTTGGETAAGGDSGESNKTRQYAIIETVVRDLFSNLIATTSIESPAFVKVWNILDILSILSDDEECDPALPFWLIEELLESQTISGCRLVFDFLDSRRHRITANHFKQKQLIILRSCNELLRRLSKAEDSTFCGRVFIFMFQSFPLGDRSTVNLRGEYHVENVTTFDDHSAESESPSDKMEVDTNTTPDNKPPRVGNRMSDGTPKPNASAEVSSQTRYDIYRTFWTLQESFSQPKLLFENSHFEAFKKGIETTMKVFQEIHREQDTNQSRSIEDSGRKTLKRKLSVDGRDELDMIGAFNPKYLTSRDLFELETSDLSFRRHVLVQAMIVMDFLLSLAPKGKEKLTSIKAPNKSVAYIEQSISEENLKWTTEMKRSITDYLKQGNEGLYFHRMVETVLSRDKNWVRWKIKNCPPIQKPPISPEVFVEARTAVHRATTNKRLRPTPMGSLPLGFLQEADPETEWARLKAPERFQIPDLDSFQGKLSDVDFDIERAPAGPAKAAAVEHKASLTWQALRIASKTKLALFDKIDDPDNIDVIFQDVEAPEPEPEPANDGNETDSGVASGRAKPADTTPIVLASATEAGAQTALVDMLVARHGGVFARVVRHTTQPPTAAQTNGRDFHFVTAQAFNMMLDGDRFLQVSRADEQDYGTSRAAVEEVAEAGKIAVFEADAESLRQIKDTGFSARFILVKQPSDTGDSTLGAMTVEATVVGANVETALAQLEDIIWKTTSGDAPTTAATTTTTSNGDDNTDNNDAETEAHDAPIENGTVDTGENDDVDLVATGHGDDAPEAVVQDPKQEGSADATMTDAGSA